MGMLQDLTLELRTRAADQHNDWLFRFHSEFEFGRELAAARPGHRALERDTARYQEDALSADIYPFGLTTVTIAPG